MIFVRNLLASMGAVLTLMIAMPYAGASECQEGELVIRFSHVTAYAGNPKGDAATELSDRVNSEMDGRMCMEVYANSDLFDDERVIEALLLGDVQLAAPSLSRLEAYTGSFRLFDLFFLFQDIGAVDAFQASSAGVEMLDSLEQYGMVGLTYWHSGMKQMSANRSLLVPTDILGLRIRVQPSDVLESSFRAFGALPQKLAFSELPGALQNSAVHGQENTWSNILTQGLYLHQAGITETNHGVLDYILLMSLDFWQSIPDVDRTQFHAILEEVTIKYNKLAEQINQQAKQDLIRQGIVIRDLAPAQRQMWIDAIRPHWERFLPAADHHLIDEVLALQQGE